MKENNKRIAINLPNGFRLVAEQNQDPNFQNEIHIGIETVEGVWLQNLAIVRNAYSVGDNLTVMWSPDILEVLIYTNEKAEDYTNKFPISINREDV